MVFAYFKRGPGFCILVILSCMREILLVLWFTFGRSVFRPALHNPAEARKRWLGWMQKLSLTLCLAAFILTVYGIYNALKIPQVERVEVVSSRLPSQLNGFTIAQLSDLHISSSSGSSWLSEVVKETIICTPI